MWATAQLGATGTQHDTWYVKQSALTHLITHLMTHLFRCWRNNWKTIAIRHIPSVSKYAVTYKDVRSLTKTSGHKDVKYSLCSSHWKPSVLQASLYLSNMHPVKRESFPCGFNRSLDAYMDIKDVFNSGNIIHASFVSTTF